jgi:hypothetical protein
MAEVDRSDQQPARAGLRVKVMILCSLMHFNIVLQYDPVVVHTNARSKCSITSETMLHVWSPFFNYEELFLHHLA